MPGEFTKNGEDAVLPVRPAMCETLRPLIARKHPKAPLFDLPSKYNMARMLRQDLTDAGIDSKDDGTGKIDFHSLRHTFGTLLAASGLHPKVAQELMRQSDINSDDVAVYPHCGRGAAGSAGGGESARFFYTTM